MEHALEWTDKTKTVENFKLVLSQVLAARYDYASKIKTPMYIKLEVYSKSDKLSATEEAAKAEIEQIGTVTNNESIKFVISKDSPLMSIFPGREHTGKFTWQWYIMPQWEQDQFLPDIIDTIAQKFENQFEGNGNLNRISAPSKVANLPPTSDKTVVVAVP